MPKRNSQQKRKILVCTLFHAIRGKLRKYEEIYTDASKIGGKIETAVVTKDKTYKYSLRHFTSTQQNYTEY